jgi:hypothetical protein
LTLVALVKAALISSTAFFIEAAANTVTVVSCARAVGAARSADKATMKAVRFSMTNLLARKAPSCRSMDGKTCRNRRSGIGGARTGRRGSECKSSKSLRAR